MQFGDVESLVSQLRGHRLRFPYFKDRYALLLLEHAARSGVSIAALKRGRYARLLDKPLVRRVLARSGSGHIHADDIRAYRPAEETVFRVGLAWWPDDENTLPGWDQTTQDEHNLVLQLNFPLKHNHRARRLMGKRIDWLDSCIHPCRLDKEITLAWARIDLAFGGCEALIEEIQSDWVGEVHSCSQPKQEHANAFRHYADEQLAPHVNTWDEAMLAATLWFLLRLGVCDVYFHTFDSGSRLKNMGRSRPPRSIYTRLPRRFCFETTANAPHFLRRTRNPRLRRQLRNPRTRWHRLRL